MLHPSNTFPTSLDVLNFTDDTIVFFGFPADNNAGEKARKFAAKCAEMGIAYWELAFAPSKYWHYEKCFGISVGSDNDLNAIQPIITHFGELNALADADETVIVLRTREEIQKMYVMIRGVYPAHESESSKC